MFHEKNMQQVNEKHLYLKKAFSKTGFFSLCYHVLQCNVLKLGRCLKDVSSKFNINFLFFFTAVSGLVLL